MYYDDEDDLFDILLCIIIIILFIPIAFILGMIMVTGIIIKLIIYFISSITNKIKGR